MKKILICLLVCLIALPMHAEDPTVTINGVVYEYNFTYTIHEETAPGTNTYSFSGWARVKDGQDAEGDVEIVDAIPVVVDNVTGKTEDIHISSIVSGAFDNNTKITSVFIPDGVWLSGGFYGCTSLKSVSLPGGINIPDRCFSGCTNLETVTFRGGINKIGTDSFRSCTSLKSIDLSKGVKELGRSFYLCSGLKSVTLPETGLTSIGECCFEATAIEYLNIPASVTSISSSICKNCKSLKEVVIPNCNSISGQSHFLNCTSLTKVTVTGEFEMPNYMFCGCSSLKTVILNKVKTIGYQGFYGCTSLESITIPNTVTRIGINAFEGCTALKSIDIPNSVTVINGSAFSGCSTLSSVTLPSALTELDGSAFRNCTSLVSIGLPASITELGTNELFYGCTNLKSVTLCQANRIGNNMFQNCKSLESITIPNTVKIICSEAFKGCTALKSITIPNSVTEIQARAFENCSSLRRVELSSNLENMASSGGSVFQNCTSLLSMTFPSTMKELGTGVFNNCTSLILIDLRASTKLNITSKDRNVYFWGVPESTVILLPGEIVSEDEIPNIQDDEEAIEFADANVKAICIANWDTNDDGELSLAEAAAVTSLDNTFRNESEITLFDELQYFTSLTSIPDNAFYNCRKLASIIIPEGVASITSKAFYYCNNLTSITVVSNNPIYDSRNNCNAIIRKSDNALVVGCKNTIIPNGVEKIISSSFISYPTSIVIPSSVSSIGSGVFQHVSSLAVEEDNPYYDSRENCNAIIRKTDNKLLVGCKSTTIPSSVTSIGDYAFEKCGISNITIPATVKSIGQSAFEYASLTAITLEEGIQSIGYMAFAHCGFTTIHIPSSVNSIGSGVEMQTPFLYCQNLSSITVAEGNEYYDSRDNCNAIIRKSDNRLIAGCKSTIIPSSVKIIGNSAFHTQICKTSSEDKIVENLIIPEGVTTIELMAFAYTGIRSVSIPSSVTSIGEYAFDQCTFLSTVRVERTSPPATSSHAFWTRPITKLYVPSGCSAAYQAKYPWNEMGEIIEYEEENGNIEFTDPNVKELCVQNWDTDDDGELSKEEAAAVTDLGEVFKGNKTITSFDELQYFTGLTSIPDRAFDNCNNLTSLRLPESITSIGLGAFLHCDLQSIYIPASVEEIGIYPFVHNNNLTSIQVDAANTRYDSRNECNAIIETSSNTLIQGCKTTVIPSGIKKIGNFAFEFVDLSHIDLPQSLEEISWNAFYGCANLDEVVFPDGLKSIARFAYNGCANFKSIVLPASLTYVGGASFAGCYNIETLSVAPGGETYISPDGSNAIVSKDGTTLVAGCKNTVIPESVVTIGSKCFYDQKNLTKISIPASVKTIEDRAFCGCIHLTEVVIPKDVETIGDNAFNGCQTVSVTIRREQPITITANVFTDRASSTLYVPKGSKAAYEAADYWKEFKEIKELPSVIAANLEQGSFNINPATKAFTVKLDKAANAAKIEATLDGKALTVSPAEGLVEEITLNYAGDDLANGLHTIIVTKVYPADESIGEDNYYDFTYEFSVGAPDPNDQPIDLIPISYFNDCSYGSVPEGFLLYADGMEERVAGGSYGSGSRLFNDFADGGDFTSALYIRSNYLTYGLNDDEHRLTLEAGKTYTLSFNTARWKSSGEFLKVQILNLNGEPQFEQTVTCDPNVNGSKAVVKGSSAYSFEFTPATSGDYELRFVVANNAEGEDASENWHEILLANVKFGYIPSSFGFSEMMAVNEALEKAQRTQKTYAIERYEGAVMTVLNQAIAQVEADKAGYTSPSECNAAVKWLNQCGDNLIDHAALCNNYDQTIENGIDIVRLNAENKFSTLQMYADLVAVVSKYHGSAEWVYVGVGEEGNLELQFTYDKLTDDAELNAALDELTGIVETTQKYFTIGESSRGTTGVAALVERLRLGAEGLMALGVDADDTLVVNALDALDDDDQMAEELKTRTKTELYNLLTDPNNKLFTPDDWGEAPQYDMTVFVKNPNLYAREFTKEIEGWEKISGNAQAWSNWDGNISHSEKTAYPEDCAFSLGWHTVANVEQTIHDLPAGVYTIKFDAWDNSYTSDDTYAYVKLSDTPNVESGSDVDMDINYAGYALMEGGRVGEITDVVVTDGYLTLGFAQGSQSQAFVESIHLYLTSPADVDYASLSGDTPSQTDAIYINDFSARVGASSTMEINLKNSKAATAYVFDLVLPEGITVAKNESGKYIDELSDRHDDHSRTFNYKGGNTYSLSTLSGNSELLTGNDGAIRIVTLSVADDLPVGTYTIDIKNASYSLPDGSLVELPDTKAVITVEDYVMGDVNGNGKVDIGDAVTIVNYLVGKESTNFVEKAADTNKNGKVDIGDAVTIVNFLVGKTSSLSRTIGVEQDEREPQ